MLDVFPQSTRVLSGGIQTFAASESVSESGSSWWVPFSERTVFQARLQNQQYSNDGIYDPQRSWDLRIGKGGNIYSMRGSFGEAVPPQFRSPLDPDGPYYAPWVDEVFQSVFVDTVQNVPTNKYFHHQAGIYLKDDTPGGQPFPSPCLGSIADVSNRTYRIVSWPQQAHVPTEHTSDIICYTEYRNVGQGILEVNTVAYNFGIHTQNYLNNPWGGVRDTSFGHHFLSDTAGALIETESQFIDNTTVEYNDTAGWVLFSAGTNAYSDTIGVVFGKDTHLNESWQTSESKWRYGNAGNDPPPGTPENEWRNFFVGTTIRYIRIAPGECFFGRYYLCFGRQDTVVNQLIGPYGLVDHCDYDVYSINRAEAEEMVWYRTTGGFPTTDPNGEVIVTTYNKPVSGTLPLFVLQETATGTVRLSTDPYQLSDKPYDGTTEYLGFLGFVSAQTDIAL